MRSELWLGVLWATALQFPGAATASPPLSLPAWATAAAEPTGGWELGREVGLVVSIEALVGAVRAQPPTLSGEGFRLLSGPQPAAPQTSAPGRPARWRFRLLLAAAGPVRIGARLPAQVPRQAMEAQLPAMYPDAPADRLSELKDRIRGLGGTQILEAFARVHLSPEEGFMPGDGARFSLYYPVGRALFPLWDPPAPPGSGAASAALASASPRLARLLREAGAVSPVPGAGEYPGLLADLRAADPARAEALANTFAGQAGRAGIEGYAAAMGEAAALARAGRAEEAVGRLRALAQRPGPSHYAWFALGEMLVATGRGPEASLAYAKALDLRPVFGLARRRFEPAGGP